MDNNVHEQHNNIVQFLVVLLGSLHALTFQQWVSLIVVLTGVISMLINWYYKHKTLKLQEKQHN
jgi:uncharacterized membrane protein